MSCNPSLSWSFQNFRSNSRSKRREHLGGGRIQARSHVRPLSLGTDFVGAQGNSEHKRKNINNIQNRNLRILWWLSILNIYHLEFKNIQNISVSQSSCALKPLSCAHNVEQLNHGKATAKCKETQAGKSALHKQVIWQEDIKMVAKNLLAVTV